MSNPAAALSQQMFQLVTGYWVSQSLGTLAKLGIPDALASGPKSAAELGRALELDPGATFRLLRAGATIGVVRGVADARFELTPLGETLRSDVPGSMCGMAIAQTSPGHWQPWGRLADAVRTGQHQTKKALGQELFDYYADARTEADWFMGAMNGLSALVAGELVRLVDLSGMQKVVDVGGSGGTLLSAVLRANPAMQGVLADLPPVVDASMKVLATTELASRITGVGGDFFESVPAGGQLYVLKQILHDWDDEQCVTILKNCARAMDRKGRVVVVEMLIPDDGAPSPAALMDVNMLALLPGRERTLAEYRAIATLAGLEVERVQHTESPFSLVELVAR